MPAGVTPLPSHTSDIRSNSVSKQAQQSLPRFRMRPLGVRLFAGQSFPSSRASRTDEKKGKPGSTKSAQAVGSALFSVWRGPDLAAIEPKGKSNKQNNKIALRPEE